MDNSKKSVHNSGPLGMLVKTGQIKKIELNDDQNDQKTGNLQHVGMADLKSAGAYFKTQSGIKFNENELVFIDPKECEPWEYANRSSSEMGEMDELINSIRVNHQLQPALIRTHPTPHDNIKYQVIFGRRRHAACLQLGIPLLVIKKDHLSLQEAIACQDAENKFRKDISNYSNALLYKKLLENKVFKTEKDLAEKLHLSTSTLNDLMTYTKIPSEIINKLPNINELPVYMAIKIVRLIASNPDLIERFIAIAPEIGKSITTPSKLESMVLAQNNKKNVPHRTKIIKDEMGKTLFTFKVDHKGVPSITFQKELLNKTNFDELCEKLKNLVALGIKSGRPDLVT